jgi:hypothetical protein
MKNNLAIALLAAADKYLAWNTKAFSDDPEMVKVGQSDYQDLITIAGMIENYESPIIIQKAMRNLDTAVRDIIPDDVYYAFASDLTPYYRQLAK